jgi:phosphoserine phosphatase
MEVGTIAGLAAQFVRHEVLPVLRPFLLRRLDEHRQAGDRIVLLTGAPDFIAEPLGRAIGAWAVVATRPAMTRARFDSRAPLLHPFDVAKLGCARELCAEIGARLDECTAYADAAPDLHLLRDVGRPIAVTPDPALERVAREHGWEIILPEDLAPVWGETGRVSVPD